LAIDAKRTYKVNLEERVLTFASDVIKFLFLLPNTMELDVFKIQLSKAGTSIGTNYEESQASTYKEFSHRIRICLRFLRTKKNTF
jgi:four helix bundle protein